MQFLEEARSAYNTAVEEREAAWAAVESLEAEVEAEERDRVLADYDEKQTAVDERKTSLDDAERRAAAREATPPIVIEEDEEKRHTAPKGGKGEATYRPEAPHSFYRDMVAARKGDIAAQERLQQHKKESRDLTTVATDGGGFAPPQYLNDLWANVPRQGRAVADLFPTVPLPASGVSFSVPRMTTGATVAVQASENAAVNEVDLVEAVITRTLVTIAGQQDVSQQLLDRSEPGIDRIIFADLMADYDNKLDISVLNGAGSSGDNLGIRAVTSVNTVTYTDASPTAAELVPKIYDAIQKVQTNRMLPADTIIMHPRRAAWLASNLSSTFPLFQLGSLNQAAGQQDMGKLTSFSGLRVVVDANVGVLYGAATNEDEIYVVRAADFILAEGPVQSRMLSEVGSGTLTVRLQVYGYSAAIAGRYPSSISIISGTGLVAPTF